MLGSSQEANELSALVALRRGQGVPMMESINNWEVVVISDQKKGLIAALAEKFLRTHHQHCAKHLEHNICAIFRHHNLARAGLWAAVGAGWRERQATRSSTPCARRSRKPAPLTCGCRLRQVYDVPQLARALVTELAGERRQRAVEEAEWVIVGNIIAPPIMAPYNEQAELARSYQVAQNGDFTAQVVHVGDPDALGGSAPASSTLSSNATAPTRSSGSYHAATSFRRRSSAGS
ncbi:unnamed protein product [Phaeothamnion confervicola]